MENKGLGKPQISLVLENQRQNLSMSSLKCMGHALLVREKLSRVLRGWARSLFAPLASGYGVTDPPRVHQLLAWLYLVWEIHSRRRRLQAVFPKRRWLNCVPPVPLSSPDPGQIA